MHTRPKHPLLTRVSLVALIAGAALVTTAALVLYRPLAPATDLPPSALRTGLALFSFLFGVALSAAFILRSVHKAYQARVVRLKQERRALEELNHELQRQATSDALLGTANRREFERVLDQEWRRAARERQPLGLLMIDVDCFKRYNDTYGHPEGDDCLRQVASVLTSVVSRPGDLVARYGGEEMVVLLPRTDLAGVSHMARRIHDRLAERAIAYPDSPVADHVTVSIGAAAILPVRRNSAQTLVKQADEGLYAAKRNGRNRTETVPPLRLIAREGCANASF